MEDLAETLRTFFPEVPILSTVSAEGLNDPTPELATAIYEAFVKEFGLSQVLGPRSFARLLAQSKWLDGSSGRPDKAVPNQAEVYRLVLLMTIRWLLGMVHRSGSVASASSSLASGHARAPPTFGLLDVLEPNPDRFQVFVKTLFNFWLYANRIRPEASNLGTMSNQTVVRLRKRADQVAAAGNVGTARHHEAPDSKEKEEEVSELMVRCKALNEEIKLKCSALAAAEGDERVARISAEELESMEQKLKFLTMSMDMLRELGGMEKEMGSTLQDKDVEESNLCSILAGSRHRLEELKEVAKAFNRDLQVTELTEAEEAKQALMLAEKAIRLEGLRRVATAQRELEALRSSMRDESTGVKVDFQSQKAGFEAFQMAIIRSRSQFYPIIGGP